MTISIKQIKSKLLISGSLKSHFIISNLSKGLGLTIGNSLRRLLLSHLNGTSIIALKIPGILSEFSSIYGLREDVLELILNLKEVILRSKNDSIHHGKINIQGPGVITAKCILFDSDIKIINPNLYIATLYTKQLINFEIIAQKSRGYSFSNNSQNQFSYSTFLMLDAIFMPVLCVNYTIKIQRKFTILYTESLLLEITTNGSISPNEALINSATFFETIFNYIQQARKVSFLE